MVMDHLPGGKFWDPSGGLIEESKSTMTHNKLPEFVFGQLDQLLRYRPNSTLLANESYLLYSHNKTGKWLDSLSEVERNLMIDKSRKEGVEIRKNFKLRLLEIERKRLEDMKKKQEDLVRKEKKRLKDAENITNTVCFYGLWQSPLQVDEGLGRMPENEQRKVLESQLKFRKTVLKQRHTETKIFIASSFWYWTLYHFGKPGTTEITCPQYLTPSLNRCSIFFPTNNGILV
jgi:E1A/CREB-binding protein